MLAANIGVCYLPGHDDDADSLHNNGGDQMHSIAAGDDRNHQSNGDEKWQGSWAFSWFDPVNRVAGYHHTGMQRVRGIADCWSWLSVDGRLVYRFNDNQMALH